MITTTKGNRICPCGLVRALFSRFLWFLYCLRVFRIFFYITKNKIINRSLFYKLFCQNLTDYNELETKK